MLRALQRAQLLSPRISLWATLGSRHWTRSCGSQRELQEKILKEHKEQFDEIGVCEESQRRIASGTGIMFIASGLVASYFACKGSQSQKPTKWMQFTHHVGEVAGASALIGVLKGAWVYAPQPTMQAAHIATLTCTCIINGIILYVIAFGIASLLPPHMLSAFAMPSLPEETSLSKKVDDDVTAR
eukprot:TRINITY_DN110567_c0_g1_i1.p1 TRINITY_DN110567_c0_g1~~TRINITY_DN110567_c0_g1_i1.p1  ORF type:complete len:198 (-),score=27.64 TRINITY_DN110567_c0_g1_i1:105-659(-)